MTEDQAALLSDLESKLKLTPMSEGERRLCIMHAQDHVRNGNTDSPVFKELMRKINRFRVVAGRQE